MPGRDGTTLQLQRHPYRSLSPDERVTNASRMTQDHLQQTLVISQRRSQKTLTEQAVSKTQGNAAHEAM